jgi:hypothetical protein
MSSSQGLLSEAEEAVRGALELVLLVANRMPRRAILDDQLGRRRLARATALGRRSCFDDGHGRRGCRNGVGVLVAGTQDPFALDLRARAGQLGPLTGCARGPVEVALESPIAGQRDEQ